VPKKLKPKSIEIAKSRVKVKKILDLLFSVRCDNFRVLGLATWQAGSRGKSTAHPRWCWPGKKR